MMMATTLAGTSAINVYVQSHRLIWLWSKQACTIPPAQVEGFSASEWAILWVDRPHVLGYLPRTSSVIYLKQEILSLNSGQGLQTGMQYPHRGRIRAIPSDNPELGHLR
jgi:hypothetical protein